MRGSLTVWLVPIFEYYRTELKQKWLYRWGFWFFRLCLDFKIEQRRRWHVLHCFLFFIVFSFYVSILSIVIPKYFVGLEFGNRLLFSVKEGYSFRFWVKFIRIDLVWFILNFHCLERFHENIKLRWCWTFCVAIWGSSSDDNIAVSSE